jgi:hypothetical protein
MFQHFLSAIVSFEMVRNLKHSHQHTYLLAHILQFDYSHKKYHIIQC